MNILKKVFLLFVSVLLVACSADEKLVTNDLWKTKNRKLFPQS